MMFNLHLTLKANTGIRTNAQAGNFHATENFIPGATLRGAFAAAWIRKYGAPTANNPQRKRFQELFEGGVRFGPAYLGGQAPYSLSVKKLKYEDKPNKGHDAEYDEASTARQHFNTQIPDKNATPPRSKNISPDYVQAKGLEKTPEHVTRTHVAVDLRDQAIEGQLFTRKDMRAEQEFIAQLVCSDEHLTELANLGAISVGSRRTTHGLCEVTATNPVADIDYLSVFEVPEDNSSMILRLTSPAVFIDHCGAPVLEPHPAQLEELLECAVTIKKAWARWEVVGGWHAASGLPKPSEPVAAAGSTYLIEVTSGAITVSGLQRLCRQGVGIRRHEGFGHVQTQRPVLNLTAEPQLASNVKAR